MLLDRNKKYHSDSTRSGSLARSPSFTTTFPPLTPTLFRVVRFHGRTTYVRLRHNVASGCYAKDSCKTVSTFDRDCSRDALAKDEVKGMKYERMGRRREEKSKRRRRRRVRRTMAHVVRAIPPYRTTHDTTCHNSSSCSTVISAEPVGLTNISCPCNPVLLSIPRTDRHRRRTHGVERQPLGQMKSPGFTGHPIFLACRDFQDIPRSWTSSIVALADSGDNGFRHDR